MTWDDPHLQAILSGSTSKSASSFKGNSNKKCSKSSKESSYLAQPHSYSGVSSVEKSSKQWSSYSAYSTLNLPDFSTCSSRFNSKGQPLWNEPIPIACARVDALRSHGYKEAAVRLAVAVARTLKHIQEEAHDWWLQLADKVVARCSSSGWCRWLITHETGLHAGWIGHPLDPITTLFDCLAEASLVPEDVKRFQYHSEWHGIPSEEASTLPLRFRHHPIPDSCDPWESYLSLALEAALIGLGQQRLMPQGLYSQEKGLKQEEKLIMKLHELNMDSQLIHVLRRQAQLLLEGGPFSGLGEGICPEAVPLHTYSKFLFSALLLHNPDQAYRLALRSLRLPILEEQEDPEEFLASLPPLPPNRINSEQQGHAPGADRNLNALVDRYNIDRLAERGNNNHHLGERERGERAERALFLPRSSVNSTRWFTLTHIETQQCSLACAVISAAANDVLRLRAALDAALRNIHSSNHLFKLAQDAFRLATPQDGPRNTLLLNAALELGLQVLRLTLSCVNWRRREMVRWLVTCATEVGVAALMSIMQGWYALLTPPEAVAGLASTVMAHNTVMRLSLDRQQQDELAGVARTLALQCATKDPPSCALNALTLCEGDAASFEAAYQVVVDAASSSMTSSQLFSIARYTFYFKSI